MHIIIGILTAIAGVIWALYRLQNSGVDLNSFNPFHWFRRRNWEKKLGVRPLHRLEKPMEVAAVLAVGVIRLEGEFSREQKADTINLFEKEFRLNRDQSAELFSASGFLLKDVMDLSAEVRNIVAPSKQSFTLEQTDSLISLLQSAAKLDGAPSNSQHQLIELVKQELAPEGAETGKWS